MSTIGDIISDFANWIADEIIKPVLDWVKEFFQWIARKIWQELTESFATLVESLEPPAFMTQYADPFAGIDPTIMYFASVMQIPEGFGIVMTAYAARFALRRIPGIG